MAWRVCSTPGCGKLHEGTGKCPDCRTLADKTRTSGKYTGTAGHSRFREDVLALNPRCVCPGDCGRHTGWCGQPATVADHYPIERADMITLGRDPNDPTNGRGLCHPCHSAHTARTRPGGWNQRPQ